MVEESLGEQIGSSLGNFGERLAEVGQVVASRVKLGQDGKVGAC